MKQETREFIRKVVFTTALSFTLISFFFIGITAWFDTNETMFERFVFFRFIFGKELCIFLFALCLGFVNRIPEIRKGRRAILRLAHFAAALASYALAIIFLFNIVLLEPGETAKALNPKNIIWHIAMFLLFYFVTLGVTALGRRVFLKEKPAPYKSILD